MYFTRTSAIVLRFLYLLRGSPARWLPLFVWVAIDILLWGFITKYLNSITTSGLNFIPRLLGAVIFFDFLDPLGGMLDRMWGRQSVMTKRKDGHQACLVIPPRFGIDFPEPDFSKPDLLSCRSRRGQLQCT